MKVTRYNAQESARNRELNGLPLASFRVRAAAIAVDFVLAGLAFMLIVYPIAVLLVKSGAMETHGDVTLRLNFFNNWYSVVWLVLYFGASTYLGKGQTLGKKLFGIRVVSVVHERLGFWHSVERALGYGASALEFGFGFLQYFLDPNRRTVHDRIAETIVISVRGPSRRPSEPDAPTSQPAEPKG